MQEDPHAVEGALRDMYQEEDEYDEARAHELAMDEWANGSNSDPTDPDSWAYQGI
jgi:hypothetical protein